MRIIDKNAKPDGRSIGQIIYEQEQEFVKNIFEAIEQYIAELDAGEEA